LHQNEEKEEAVERRKGRERTTTAYEKAELRRGKGKERNYRGD
jgi:hypothetical protein